MTSNRWIPATAWQALSEFLAGAAGCVLGRLDSLGRVVAANPELAARLAPHSSAAFEEHVASSVRGCWQEILARVSQTMLPQTLELAFESQPKETYQCLVGPHDEGGYWLVGVRAADQGNAGDEASGLARRLADLERARAEAERQARTDQLTGLANRWQAEIWLKEAAEDASLQRESASCLMLDIDQLKALNDSHGHHVGDRALVAAARAFRQVVRATDHVARYGGDEFLILLPQTNLDGARVLAQRLKSALAEQAAQMAPLRLTASIGVAALVPGSGEQAETLRDRADGALLRAKRAGGDRIETG